jgi:hypothetical protein
MLISKPLKKIYTQIQILERKSFLGCISTSSSSQVMANSKYLKTVFKKSYWEFFSTPIFPVTPLIFSKNIINRCTLMFRLSRGTKNCWWIQAQTVKHEYEKFWKQ